MRIGPRNMFLRRIGNGCSGQPVKGAEQVRFPAKITALNGVAHRKTLNVDTRLRLWHLWDIHRVMFRGAPFVHFPQPIRGLVLIAGAAMLAALMYELYRSGLSAFHALKSGPPAYAQELWMSSAMLAITFLAMVTFADYFDFWPLIRNRMQPLD